MRVREDDDQPLVTLAVKAFAQEATVAAAIEGAFAQTWPRLEILLSDDCSPDGTFAVMERMAAGYRGPHRLVLNRNPRNLGIVGHENRIWELAAGRLLVQAASDDVSLPHRVERLVAAWKAGGAEVLAVHSAMQLVGGDGRELGTGRPNRATVEDPSLERLVLSHSTGIGATALYDRRLRDLFGPIPEGMGVEDRILFLRAALAGRIAYVDEPLLRYCVDGVSGRDDGYGAEAWLHGARMKLLGWLVASDRQLLLDAEAVGRPLAPELEAFCRRFVEMGELQLALSRAGVAQMPGLVVRALGLAARRGEVEPLVHAARYLGGPLYVRWADWRHGPRLRAAAAAAAADPERTVARFKWE